MKAKSHTTSYREFIQQLQNSNPKADDKPAKHADQKESQSRQPLKTAKNYQNQSHSQSQATVANHYPYHKHNEYQNHAGSHNDSCKTQRNFVKIKISNASSAQTNSKSQKAQQQILSMFSHSEWGQNESPKKLSQPTETKQIHSKSWGKGSNSSHSCNRFLSEIRQVLSGTVRLKQDEDLESHKISYIQFLESLKGLRMIHDSYQPYPHDMVISLWSESVCQNTVGNFMAVVGSILKFGNQAGLMGNSSDYYLVQKYQDMRMVRLELNRSQSRSPAANRQPCQDTASKQNQGFPFKPKISQRSRELAANRSKSRENLKQKKNRKIQNSLSGQTALNGYSFSQHQKSSHPRYKTDISAENQHQYQNNDQFEPAFLDTLNPSNSMTLNRFYNPNIRHESKSREKDSKGNNRSEMLYRLGKSKSAEKRNNAKTRNDIDYEKNIKELTFHPKISKPNKSLQKMHSQKKSKGQEQTINRIIKARVEKEVKKTMKEKGMPYNERIVNKLRKQKLEDIYEGMSESHLNENTFNLSGSLNSICRKLNHSANLSKSQFQHDGQTPNKVKEFEYRDPSRDSSASKNNSATHSPQSLFHERNQQNSAQNQNTFSGRPEDTIVVSIFVEQDHSQQLIYHQKHESLRQAAERFAKDHNLGGKEFEKLVKELEKIVQISQLSCIKEQSEDSIDHDHRDF